MSSKWTPVLAALSLLGCNASNRNPELHSFNGIEPRTLFGFVFIDEIFFFEPGDRVSLEVDASPVPEKPLGAGRPRRVPPPGRASHRRSTHLRAPRILGRPTPLTRLSHASRSAEPTAMGKHFWGESEKNKQTQENQEGGSRIKSRWARDRTGKI